jgi:hypothetical protein
MMKGEPRPSFIPSLVSAAVLLSLAWTTAPQLLHLAREATTLAPLSRRERCARVNGAIVEGVRRIKRVQPPDKPVALLGPSGFIIFANYYGYPWLSRDYGTLEGYRGAANQPRRPGTIVVVDDRGARYATYAGLRDEHLRASRAVHEAALKSAPRSFVIPLAGSVDGFPPDTFVTEAEFANDSGAPLHVRVTLLPEQKIRMLTIPPHGSLAFYDLVYQLFHEMEVRWATVESDVPAHFTLSEGGGRAGAKGLAATALHRPLHSARRVTAIAARPFAPASPSTPAQGKAGPLRAGVWFVNRGRNEVVPLPLVETWSTGALTCPAAECKVWVLNRVDRGIKVRVDGQPVALTARGMTSQPFRGTVHVASHGDAFAFATTKGPPTRFVWPAGVHP